MARRTSCCSIRRGFRSSFSLPFYLFVFFFFFLFSPRAPSCLGAYRTSFPGRSIRPPPPPEPSIDPSDYPRVVSLTLSVIVTHQLDSSPRTNQRVQPFTRSPHSTTCHPAFPPLCSDAAQRASLPVFHYFTLFPVIILIFFFLLPTASLKRLDARVPGYTGMFQLSPLGSRFDIGKLTPCNFNYRPQFVRTFSCPVFR